jgi:hypothetical protein
MGYPSTTAINSDEVSQLKQLGAMVKPGDFVIAWWDYAYAIWYHTGARTIVDGAKQNRDTWFAAEILFTSSQREAAGLARMVAEKQVRYLHIETIMSDVLNSWHQKSGQPASDFVPSLREGRAELPPATRAVYLYLPWRFVGIMPAVAALRPARGLVPDDELSFDAFLRLLPNAGNRPESISGWTFDRDAKVLRSNRGAAVKVYKDVEITTSGNRVMKREGVMHEDGRACVVRLRHTNMLLFMSRDVYESVFAQLLFLVQPDPQFFKLVSYGRGGAIYQVML